MLRLGTITESQKARCLVGIGTLFCLERGTRRVRGIGAGLTCRLRRYGVGGAAAWPPWEWRGCYEQEIWEIGDEYVTKLHRQRSPVLARADLRAKYILNRSLQIVPHPDPHPRHADIEGWPNDEEMEMII